MYDGPIIDAFLHAPWIGRDDPADPRADRNNWVDDPRLARVMATFHHGSANSGHLSPLPEADVRATMQASGVTRGLLVAKVYYAAPRKAIDATHRELARISAGSGDAFRWVGTLEPPEHGAGSYWDLMRNTRLIDEIAGIKGLVGIHITPSPWALPPNDRWYYPVYAKCVERGLALFSYVGMPGPLWPMGPNNPAHLEDVALAFPELTIIAHHIGDPWTDIMVRLAARHPNVYICTSAWAPKAYPPELMAFLKGRWHGTAGAEKVLFATDYPILDMARAVRQARALDLSEALKAFLHDNAARLLWR